MKLKTLLEYIKYRLYWVNDDGIFIEVKDHFEYLSRNKQIFHNIDQHNSGDEMYDEAYSHGYTRVVLSNTDMCISFNYRMLTNLAKKEIFNFIVKYNPFKIYIDDVFKSFWKYRIIKLRDIDQYIFMIILEYTNDFIIHKTY